MVAYNLMLAVFPFALLVLFVFGQVLKIEGVETSVARRPAAPLPQRRAGHADRRAQPDRGQLDDDRDRRLRRLALDRRLLLGGDGHRLLPHLPRRVPRLGRAEALLLRDARRRPPLHRRQHLPADDRERRSSPAPTGCPSGSPTSRRSTPSLLLGAALLVTFLICCVIFWAVPKGHMPWRAVWPGAALRHRHRRRSPTGSSRSTSPTSPASPRFGSTLGFILIALLWFYVLSLALMAGAVINSLRHELHDTGELPYSRERPRRSRAGASGAAAERAQP